MNDYNKQKIIYTLEQSNQDDLFHICKGDYFQNLTKKDLKEILVRTDLNFLEKLLKAIHFIGYEKKDPDIFFYYFFFRDLEDKSKRELLDSLIKVIKKLEYETLVPILGLELFDLLEKDDIFELHYNTDLYKKIIIALSKYRQELFYIKHGYCWSDKYAVIIPNEKEYIIKLLNDPEVKDYSPLIESSTFYIMFKEKEFFSIINTTDLRIFETFINSLKFSNIAVGLFPKLGNYFTQSMIIKIIEIIKICDPIIISELIKTGWLNNLKKKDFKSVLEVVEKRYLKLPRKMKKYLFMSFIKLRERYKYY